MTRLTLPILALFAGLVPFLAPVAPAAADTAAAIARADAQYATFDFEGALATCRAGIAADSTSADLWWRLTRSLTDRGARADYDGNEAKEKTSFEDAVKAGRRAVVLGSENSNAHLELAVALGRLALFRGGKDKLRMAKEIKSEADRALALDPRSHRAHHVLGRWNRGIAELSIFEKAAANTVLGGLPKGATKDAAVAHFEQAIAIDPDFANHHLELGKTYLSLGLRSKARTEFERALACPPRTPFDTEYKQEAQKLMAKTG